MGCSIGENYEHPLYKYVPEEKDADAVAWVWLNKINVLNFLLFFLDYLQEN